MPRCCSAALAPTLRRILALLLYTVSLSRVIIVVSLALIVRVLFFDAGVRHDLI